MAEQRLPGEFELIARYFAPLAAAAPGALGLTDDAALVDVAPGCRLVVTADALTAGVHFFDTDPPGAIAQKMLRVNLSDLAAKGARPLGYFMTVALAPSVDAAWLEAFVAGLATDQARYGIALMGGDTTATPGPTTLSVTALGQVRAGAFLPRGGAKAGDLIYVSGTIGDGALGLRVLRGELAGLPSALADRLVERYRLPEPRTELGPALAEAGLASACLDVSDGLVADAGHLAETSRLAALIDAARVPLSAPARAALAVDRGLLPVILAGGDDYELLFTVPPAKAAGLPALASRLGLPLAEIGRMAAGAGVQVIDETGREISLATRGYRHF